MADYDSSLPIRTETDGDVVSKIVGDTSGNVGEVNSSNELLVKDTDVATALSTGIAVINGTSTFNAVVTATDFDIRNLDYTQDNVEIKDADGDALAINTDGSLNVNIVDSIAGTEVHEYATVAAGVPGTPNTVISYTVTAGKTLSLRAAQAAASGKFKAELKTGASGSEATVAVWFGSTSMGNTEITFPQPIEVSAGDKVLLIITNEDKANSDVYGFINGNEV